MERDGQRARACSPRSTALERETLRELANRFLAKEGISGAAGHVVTPEQTRAIAALACLPVLHLGFPRWLGGWREVIVYPGEFRVKREHHDERTGVVTEGEDDLIGEARGARSRRPFVGRRRDVSNVRSTASTSSRTRSRTSSTCSTAR